MFLLGGGGGGGWEREREGERERESRQRKVLVQSTVLSSAVQMRAHLVFIFLYLHQPFPQRCTWRLMGSSGNALPKMHRLLSWCPQPLPRATSQCWVGVVATLLLQHHLRTTGVPQRGSSRRRRRLVGYDCVHALVHERDRV